MSSRTTILRNKKYSAIKNFFDGLWLNRRIHELERLATWAGRKRLWSVRGGYLHRLHKTRKRLAELRQTAPMLLLCSWAIHKVLQHRTFR